MRGVRKKDGTVVRNFDVRDELRATADRRKNPTGDEVPAFNPREGIADIAARLATMFPTLPQDTVQGVLSELFRSDAKITREQLADRAVKAMLEMTLGQGGESVAVTSFEPVASFHQDALDDARANWDEREMVAVDAADLSGNALADARSSWQGVPELPPHIAPSAPPPEALDDALGGGLAEVAASEEGPEAVLDALLAQVLTLPDASLLPCVQTLTSVLERIAADPNNSKVRRLRLANPKFAELVGRHEAALDLLRLAGFTEDPGEDGDRGLICTSDPAAAEFALVRESLRGIAEALGALPAAGAAPAPAASALAATQAAGRSRVEETQSAQSERRRRVAELTESRLKNPAAFRQEARQRGAQNKVITDVRMRPASKPAQSDRSKPAQSDRRAQHFTLSDIDRMRVQSEIANTTNYADEYRRNVQSGPARDYSTLVARGYDPELISREALDDTNRYRATHNLAPCRWNDGVARVAAQHAASMASGEAPFSHDGFDARIRAFPPGVGLPAGENLALNSGVSNVAQTAVNGWIKSPGHEKNLRGQWSLCGIGAARSSNGTWYLTQLFANGR